MKKAKVVHEKVGDGGGIVYSLGVIGALIYFIQHANNLGDVLWGILKSVLWPAFLMYHFLSSNPF